MADRDPVPPHVKGRPRGLTLHVYRRPKTEIADELARMRERDPNEEPLPPRPRTRGECENGERPCPFVSCRHHLYLDVTPYTGGVRLNFPNQEPDELPETCSLDVAERGGETLADIGRLLNLTRERVRQLEAAALRRVRQLRLIPKP